MRVSLFLSLLLSLAGTAQQGRAAQTGEVKAYLVSTVQKMKAASAHFVEHTEAYGALLAAAGGAEKAWAQNPDEVRKLVAQMQEDYKAMDSFGYESVEGIVAGVARFAPYDIYLDAGVPKGEGPAEEVSPLKLTLPSGEVIEGAGCSFTYIIEPALWGGNPKWCTPVDLSGDGKLDSRESLPRPDLLVAVAADTDAKIGALLADAQGWDATLDDCFQAMVSMTPTLSSYFDDWRESRYSKDPSGKFNAVSRISDMQGIMKGCAVMFRAVAPAVRPKDAALTAAVEAGFQDIFTFLHTIEGEEHEDAASLKPVVIDEMANQAKEKTDKLVPQIKQAAALAGVTLSN